MKPKVIFDFCMAAEIYKTLNVATFCKHSSFSFLYKYRIKLFISDTSEWLELNDENEILTDYREVYQIPQDSLLFGDF